MTEKNLSEYKRKYDVARHHAWAGSVLLAILLAVRIFIGTSEFKINEIFFIVIGIAIVLYTLISVFYTYKYRAGLSAEQKNVVEVQVHSDDIEKERLKVEKKKAKSEAKKAKKSNKK